GGAGAGRPDQAARATPRRWAGSRACERGGWMERLGPARRGGRWRPPFESPPPAEAAPLNRALPLRYRRALGGAEAETCQALRGVAENGPQKRAVHERGGHR